MRSNYILVSLLFLMISIYGQDAYHSQLLTQLQTDYGIVGGNWVFGSNESAKISSMYNYGLSASTSTVSGQDFTNVLNLQAPAGYANVYSCGAGIQNNTAINIGDRMLLVVWIKGISDANGTHGVGQMVVERAGTPYEKSLSIVSFFQNEWTQYILPFEAVDTYAAGEKQFAIQLGFREQEIQLGGLAIINYGSSYSLNQLPTLNGSDTYPGMDLNADWRAPAQQRIDSFRKSDLTILVKDQQGNPIPGAIVSVEMEEHDFGFGSAIVAGQVANNSNYNAMYESKILDLDGEGHGFNEVVFENDTKWPAWESNWFGTSQAEKANAVTFLKGQQIDVRGHTLVWGGWSNMPADMQANSTDQNYLKNRVENHVANILQYPGIENKIIDWDIINEMVTNVDLANAMDGYPGYTRGRDIYQDIMTVAKNYLPESKLYINDYMTITSGGLNSRYDTLKQYLQEIEDSGVPFDGIGFQAHISSFPVGPTTTYSILEDFNQSFGKEMKITEFDMTGVDESIHYEYVRDFLTIIFSHEKVKSFLCWGFWDGNHWLGDAPFYNLDWSIKPGGQAFLDLVFEDWWTNVSDTIGINSQAQFRPFKGRHTIRVDYDGQFIEQEINLTSDSSFTFTMNLVCGEVTNTQDFGPGSLRNAILCASSGDTILIPSVLNNQNINLNSQRLLIDKDVTIRANPQDQITIDGQFLDVVFEIEAGHSVRLEGFEIISGNQLEGRGITNAGNLVLRDMKLLENPSNISNTSSLLWNTGNLRIERTVDIKN